MISITIDNTFKKPLLSTSLTDYWWDRWVLRLLQLFKQFLKQLGWFSKKPSPAGRRSKVSRKGSLISWVIPGKLAVGGSPCPEDLTWLAKANIKVIFSLCGTSEDPLPEEIAKNFHCMRLVLPDSRYKSDIKPSQLKAAVDVVQHSVQNQLPIYVHCLAGIERSPTVCIAYLCKHYNLEIWEALNWLKQVHPVSMPNESQLRAVQAFIKADS